MAKVKFKPNPAGFKDMLRGDIADKACRPVAETIEAAAKAAAPFETGAYQASIHIVEAVHPTRKVFHVAADVDYAMGVESRTGNLARAL